MNRVYVTLEEARAAAHNAWHRGWIVGAMTALVALPLCLAALLWLVGLTVRLAPA